MFTSIILNALSSRLGSIEWEGEAPAEPEPAKGNAPAQASGSAGASPSHSTPDLRQMTQQLHAHLESAGGCGELMRVWGKAGEEALGLLRPLRRTAFRIEPLPAPARPAKCDTVLARLRDQLLGNQAAKNRLPQDTSLQIIACPGVMREVETVYNSILHNLQGDPSLKQNDIAVLVTDMTKYRAACRGFSSGRRGACSTISSITVPPARAPSARPCWGCSNWRWNPLRRSRVFSVLLNPCFLARLGIDRSQAMTWLAWAESLGICQGWDADEKAQQGYPPRRCSPGGSACSVCGWDATWTSVPKTAPEPRMRFGEVIPFADLESSDREHLDAFCRAVEGLLPTLARLRTTPMSGERWAKELKRLVQDFLDVPADRPEEGQVRAICSAALIRWATGIRCAIPRPSPLAPCPSPWCANMCIASSKRCRAITANI